MRLRAIGSAFVACLLSLTMAAQALADEGGQGIYGKTDDKVITNFGFGLMLFFTLIVILFSVLQHLLGRRKR